MGLKALLRRMIGERATGALEYFLRPSMRGSFGGPFNGQRHRREIYDEIRARLRLEAIVETGTFRGTTTRILATSGVPVYTVEMHPRFHAYCGVRFWWEGWSNVRLYRSDSRTFLRRLVADPAVPKLDVFFYLDAHWDDDLPLREELEIIFGNWKRTVVMIDDFEVPDSRYKFDDYGPGKALNLAYLQPVLSAHGPAVFFPSENASSEADRGCVVLLHGIQPPAGGFRTLAGHRA
jgi:hypothetical protein